MTTRSYMWMYRARSFTANDCSEDLMIIFLARHSVREELCRLLVQSNGKLSIQQPTMKTCRFPLIKSKPVAKLEMQIWRPIASHETWIDMHTYRSILILLSTVEIEESRSINHVVCIAFSRRRSSKMIRNEIFGCNFYWAVEELFRNFFTS